MAQQLNTYSADNYKYYQKQKNYDNKRWERLIDVHNHFFPKVYINYLKKLKKSPKVFDREGRLFLSGHPPGINVAMPISSRFYDIETKLESEVKGKREVDRIVISLGNPWTDFLESEEARELARKVNDDIARSVSKYPNKLFGLATAPLRDEPENYLEELDRAILNLGLSGVEIGTNINGKYLDSSEFLPFFERVHELDVPIFLHPTTPADAKIMENYQLIHIVGFTSETSLVVGKLIFNGILEKLPGLKLVAPHGGGGLPYLAGRFDIFYEADPSCREHIEKKPSEYLGEIYYDIILYSYPALRCLYDLVGADHLLFGTDDPFPVNLESIVGCIDKIGFSEKEKKKVFVKNALKLLGVSSL